MIPSLLKSIRKSIQYWYVPLLVGIFFVVVSLVVFFSPKSSLLALSLLFSLSFLFGGLSEVIFSMVNREQLDNWGWSLAFGIITFVVGVLFLINPSISLTALAFYIGFVILFRSISTIGFAIDVKKYGSKSWSILLILGIIGAIVSFILIWKPIFAGLGVVVLIALSFLFAGLFNIVFALQLRKLRKKSKNISGKLLKRYDDLMDEIRDEWED
ncbi:DUF308 domain-containing protein [Membranicola marinus]|uniref:DUF308 domain-containing protein n=1 Tax=Membranihabitans marinus TaxID=1227546 RepID=A0A953HUQ4_9BACT|nr:DUF308 domain-containing protein [Membranihabitans marinus]MBY5958218.1 DUF308 domain-containing protein [Membranihabitans marinus]